MQYVGGKQKSGGAQIARAVNRMIAKRGLKLVAEPFCGGLSVTSRIVAPEVLASDACRALITLYNELRSGWQPPTAVSRELWEQVKANPDPLDPLTAFVGFGCSRSGAWFDSYVELFKRTGQNRVQAALAAAESLANKLKKCARATFTVGDYRSITDADLFYCDPPYAGALPYAALSEPFDTSALWPWARAMSRYSLVLVSERVAPDDFVPALTFSLQNRLVMKSEVRRTEHVFVHESQAGAWREVL